MTFEAPAITWMAIYPQIALVVAGLVVMMFDTFSPKEKKGHLSYIALLGVFIFAAFSFYLWGTQASAFNGMIILDFFALFLNLIFALATALTILISVKFTHREHIPEGEYYTLILFAATGMSLLASGGNLLIIYLGLEIMSMSIYILTSIVRDRVLANEAALKYFLLGAFASGFLLYGIALLFGATGSLEMSAIGDFISSHSLQHSPLFLMAFCLMMVGFAFKVALVPFHMWTPDVYQGAPSPITGFMATGVKAAGFAALLRVLMYAFGPLETDWRIIFWVLSVLTMTIGNIVALVQTNIKRMLAYSSIAHAGYLSIGLVVVNKNVFGAMLFYLVAYTLMNIGAFAIIILLERKGQENQDLDDYRGLGAKYPLLALAMTIFMLSLAGIPPTAGFIGKFYIFAETIKSGALGLAIIGVLNSVLSVYYYLRVTVKMYMTPREDEPPEADADSAHIIAVTVAVLGTLILGIFPTPILHFALKCFTLF
ncbi:NADH-quinone oxidoreductase subunit N [candidate division CSSED10-310 bacterium]|uniref:NADH-quinone oxidoreductase subunit N n=1 Tax=candidate division CSSED10-310 bacterium TaxID=2855610 RepID=A0ABV6YYG5_UNCC1